MHSQYIKKLLWAILVLLLAAGIIIAIQLTGPAAPAAEREYGGTFIHNVGGVTHGHLHQAREEGHPV